MTAHLVNWRDTLAAGDIVAYKFPCPDNPSAEKARPCLVVEVDRVAGEAVVVYGTSRWTGPNRGQELHVTERAACEEASLDRPTRFIGARRLRVPVACPRFVECRDGTAVLGRLGEAFRPRLDHLRHASQRHSRRGHLQRPAGGLRPEVVMARRECGEALRTDTRQQAEIVKAIGRRRGPRCTLASRTRIR